MPQKDPESILDYSIDWTNKLQSSENISTSEWVSETEDATLITDTSTSKTTTLWVSGGTSGTMNVIKNTIETNSTPQRTFVERIYIPVKEV